MAEDCGGEPHTDKRRHLPKDIDDDYRPEDAQDVGAAHGFINLIGKYGDKQDVDDVDNGD